MTFPEIVMECLISFLFGANVMLFVAGRFIIEPQRKISKDAIEGWKRANKMLGDILGIDPETGNIRSPLQIHKHD